MKAILSSSIITSVVVQEVDLGHFGDSIVDDAIATIFDMEEHDVSSVQIETKAGAILRFDKVGG